MSASISFFHRIAISLLTFVFYALASLPLAFLQKLGAGLGWFIASLPGRYRSRLRANLSHAYPHATASMLKEAAYSAGRMGLEMPYFWARKHPLARFKQVFDEHDAVIHPLLEEGKGIIFVTPHLGCFEALAPMLASRYGLTAMFKPPNQPWLRAWIEKMRAYPGLQLAPAQSQGVRMLVRALRRGQAIGILPDQTPPLGQGVWAPFFNKPAYTITLIQKLQRISGAPIVLLFNERLSDGRGYRVHLRQYPGMLPEQAVAAATALNQAIEALIDLAPTQYLWGYNRYKKPHGMDLSVECADLAE